jgi:hypothetical protein
MLRAEARIRRFGGCFGAADRMIRGGATRWPRSLVTSGEELWVLLLDADGAVRGHAGGLVGEVVPLG